MCSVWGGVQYDPTLHFRKRVREGRDLARSREQCPRSSCGSRS